MNPTADMYADARARMLANLDALKTMHVPAVPSWGDIGDLNKVNAELEEIMKSMGFNE